jgi:hypothetical protein
MSARNPEVIDILNPRDRGELVERIRRVMLAAACMPGAEVTSSDGQIRATYLSAQGSSKLTRAGRVKVSVVGMSAEAVRPYVEVASEEAQQWQ